MTTAQSVLDYIEDVMDDFVLRPSSKIDSLMDAIEEAEAEDAEAAEAEDAEEPWDGD